MKAKLNGEEVEVLPVDGATLVALTGDPRNPPAGILPDCLAIDLGERMK